MPHPHPKTLAALQPILEAKGIKMRREWGQNLLIDGNMLAAIGRDSGVTTADIVLEIGVGAGSLTAELLPLARLVIGVDIDRGMMGVTRELLGDAPNLVTMRADVMGAHNQLNPTVEAVVRRALGIASGTDPILDDDGEAVRFPPTPKTPDLHPKLKVVANLPYSISSPVLLALLESDLPIVDMTLMLQLEVARKLCAKPGDDEWGLLSLLAGEFAEASLIRKVPAACFWPRPKVDSATVRVIPHTHKPDRAHYARLKKVAHGLFQQRRKSILNGAKIGLGMDGAAAHAWLAAAEIDPSDHAERLDRAELHRLAAAYPAA